MKDYWKKSQRCGNANGTCKRPLEPGGDDDMVCGLDVCDELDECSVLMCA